MPTRPRLALAFIAACTAATTVYALLRVGQWLLFDDANPALVVYSDHAAYFWRAWTAAYFGAAAGFAAWLRPPIRLVGHGVAVATASLVLQTLFVP